MHPKYYGVHYLSGHDIMFLHPMRVAEIRPWTFTFVNAFEGVLMRIQIPMLPTNLANLPPKKEREEKPKGREFDYTVVKM